VLASPLRWRQPNILFSNLPNSPVRFRKQHDPGNWRLKALGAGVTIPPC